jgi:PKD repeat protein
MNVIEGDIFNGFPTFFNSGNIDNSNGVITSIYGLIIGPGNTSSSGSLCNITFSSKSKSGTSSLVFKNVGEKTGVVNEIGYVSIDVFDGSVTVEGSNTPPIPPPDEPEIPMFPPPPPIEWVNHPPETPKKPVGPTFIELGVEYTFKTSSFDIDDDLIRYRFDWDDGNYSKWSDYVYSNNSVSFTYFWNSPQSYHIKAIAQDINGNNSDWSPVLNVTVSDVDSGEPPVVNIRLVSFSTANETFIFDGSESYDPDGNIVSYYWDFGDGNFGFTKICSHKYQTPGEYIVTLIVTDENGYTYSKSIPIFIAGYIAEKSGEGEWNGFFDISNFLVIIFICIFILFNIVLFVHFRRNIKDFVTTYYNVFYLKIMNWYKSGKIGRMNKKIRKINQKLAGFDSPHPVEARFLDSSVNKAIQSPVYNEVIHEIRSVDTQSSYSVDTPKPDIEERSDIMPKMNNISDRINDESFKDTEGEEAIESIVDRVLLIKKLDKKTSNTQDK